MDFLRGVKDRLHDAAHEHQAPLQSQRPTNDSSSSAVTARIFDRFYSSRYNQFCAPVKSDGTLGANDHFGYTVWSVTIAVQAIAECLPPNSRQLKTAVEALQKYYNPQMYGFCAWKYFPGVRPYTIT